MNSKISNKIILGILALSLLTNSCSDAYRDLSDNENKLLDQNETIQYQTNWVPAVVAVLAAIKVVSDVLEGRYYSKKVYHENGQLKETVDTCVGTFGTCTMNTRRTSGENLSSNPIIIQESESENIRSIKAELLKSDIGVLYAINKIHNREDCEFFFDSEIKRITGKLLIDNSTILEELGINEPIIVQGEYQVYENDEYRFIIIYED